ncbi:MAG: APC family permease, partial [Myxococcota bacterium]
HGFSMLSTNLSTPTPGGFWMALFFGFSAAMLGVSGFESSANFVEEQQEGIFPLTLRNMWVAVSFFNPIIALLALALVPLAHANQYQTTFLAHLGNQAGGHWLGLFISIDAMLVLSGAVLTSFVGVNGLARRITLDRILPQFFLKTNRRKTTHRILITFFFLCVSVLFITKGKLTALAGVYTLSFLAVMILFGVGNLLLKIKRVRLPRPNGSAQWFVVLIAIAAVFCGLYGTIIKNPEYFYIFLQYFIPALLLVGFMLSRIFLLKAFLFVTKNLLSTFGKPLQSLRTMLNQKIEQINAQQLVFFTRGDHISNLNKAILYVLNNEHTNRIKVVTVVQEHSDRESEIAQQLEVLDEVYPEIDIEFVVIEGEKFGPELIQSLSKEWNVPTNLMFIGSPGNHFLYGLAELGGVRLIL